MIKERFDLNNKVAIVTGASKGIGKAIAEGLAEYGAKVIVSSRKQAAVDEVAEELKGMGYDATGIECHVGHEEQVRNLVDKTKEIYGGIDILVNNAATNPVFSPIANVDGAAFDKTMNINVKACFILGNLCYPIMESRGGGSVINISSVEGLKPSFGLGVYSISKAALIMLTKSQAKEWGSASIRSNVICPGLIKTKFSAALWQNESILQKFTGDIASGRMALPEEMVGLACFLASNASSYCTGGVYTADGGYMVG